MREEGPPLVHLVRRLSECPAEFLAKPVIGEQGTIHVAAVVSDLVRALSGEALVRSTAAPFISNSPADRNRLRLALVAAWLLYDDWFREGALCARQDFARSIQSLLSDKLAELALLVDAERFVHDVDRREELARVCLDHFGLRPADESVAQAQDRLQTLNSIERQRIMRETRDAQQHAARVREAMRRKAAEEAAAKVSRE